LGGYIFVWGGISPPKPMPGYVPALPLSRHRSGREGKYRIEVSILSLREKNLGKNK